jgi:phage protein D
MSTAEAGLRIARPTLLIGGEEKPQVGAGLLGLLIAENTSGLYRCEARIGNWGAVNNTIDFLYFDRATIDFGKDFEVQFDGDTLFKGKIMGIEAEFPEGAPPEIRVLAEDRFQDLRMTRRTRAFADMSDSDIFTQIAGDHNLTPDISITGPSHNILAQVNQSDLAFMRERARVVGAELWIEGGSLHAKSRSDRAGEVVDLSHGGQLREFRVLADLAGQRTSVTVSGWDVSAKDALSYEATESAISSELNGDRSGVSILQSALGARKETVAHTVPLSSAEAQSYAEAFFKMSSRRFVVGRGVAETSSKLRVGAFVNLARLGPMFTGKYYLSEVRHLFDGMKGVRTEFTAERPGIGRN